MFTKLTEVLLVLVLVTGASIVTKKDLVSLISTYRTQSTLLALIAMILYVGDGNVTLLYLAILTFTSKAIIIPYVIRKVQREVQIPRDLLFHYISPSASIALSMVFLMLVYASLSKVFSELSLTPLFQLGAVFGITLALMGMMVVFSRKRVITKILGYLMMDNGVVLFSLFIAELPFIIEVLILIDLLIVVLLATILAVGMDSSLDEFQKRLHPFNKGWEGKR